MSMRYFLRRLFVVFVCLSVLFSSTFSAFASTEIYEGDDFGSDYPIMSLGGEEDTTKGNFNIRYNFGYGTITDGVWNKKMYLCSQNVPDDSIKGYQNSVSFNRVHDDFGSVFNYQWTEQFVIERVDKTKIASQGQQLKFSVKDFQTSLIAIDANYNEQRNSHFTLNGLTGLHMYVYGQNSEGVRVLHLTGSDISKYVTLNGNSLTIGGEISDIPVDTYKVNIFLTYGATTTFTNNNGNTAHTSGHWAYPILQKVWGYGDNAAVVLDVDDNTSGLLSNIIAFIKSILEGVTNIFNKIVDFMTVIANSFSTLFSKLGGWFVDLISNIASFMSSVGDWFASLFQHIIELPSKIWTVFENGLKALFVPDDEFVKDYKEEWDNVLEDRFGAIYQACDIIVEFVEGIDVASFKNTIEIPTVTIDLPDNAQFEFGGYNVRVVPEGFDFLADAVKLAVDIVCSFFVVNSLKRRFEGLMGDRL